MSDDKLKNDEPHLKVGFTLAPDFTLLAFTGFIEALRQAADVGDRSRPIWCSWSVMSHDLSPIKASCGIEVTPWESFQDPAGFDYIVLVGGLVDSLEKVPDSLMDYLRKAAAKKVPVIGLCTASFILAEAGLLKGRRCGVHWYHYQDFKGKYPEATPVIDELFVDDAGIITSPGGSATTDLALNLVEKYFGPERVMKILRHMILDWNRPVDHPQTPYMNDYQDITDPRVRRAVFFMEQNISSAVSTEDVAEQLAISTRQLERLFQIYLRESPAGYFRKLRLRHANWMLHNTRRPITDIALECGFSDSSHFAKRFKEYFGFSPSQARET
ncbi:GlxA family transcriptional regulator [Deltaproteobacteria bacterium OttesenSCG-928-K17]|nr:GlxA family transcriptional regulator [Deltaproteobacteria bacterium OttesenSCG-928-K17]